MRLGYGVFRGQQPSGPAIWRRDVVAVPAAAGLARPGPVLYVFM